VGAIGVAYVYRKGSGDCKATFQFYREGNNLGSIMGGKVLIRGEKLPDSTFRAEEERAQG